MFHAPKGNCRSSCSRRLRIVNNYSPRVEVNSGGYLPSRFGEVNIHRYSPALRRIIVLVYTTQCNSSSQIVILFSDEMGFARHFFSGNRQEVNSTWYPGIAEPIKSREKHYSLVLYVLMPFLVCLCRCDCSRESAACSDSRAGPRWVTAFQEVQCTIGHRGNTYLTSLPLVSLRRHGRVTQWKSR